MRQSPTKKCCRRNSELSSAHELRDRIGVKQVSETYIHIIKSLDPILMSITSTSSSQIQILWDVFLIPTCDHQEGWRGRRRSSPLNAAKESARMHQTSHLDRTEQSNGDFNSSQSITYLRQVEGDEVLMAGHNSQKVYLQTPECCLLVGLSFPMNPKNVHITLLQSRSNRSTTLSLGLSCRFE